MAQGETKPGYHAHTCNTCGVTWEHPTTDESSIQSAQDAIRHEQAHVCYKCGQSQYDWADPVSARTSMAFHEDIFKRNRNERGSDRDW